MRATALAAGGAPIRRMRLRAGLPAKRRPDRARRGSPRRRGGREAEDVDDDDHVRAGAEAGEAGRAPLETGAKPALELGVAQGSGRSAIRFRTCERWPISWAAMRRQKSRMSISPSRSSVNL